MTGLVGVPWGWDSLNNANFGPGNDGNTVSFGYRFVAPVSGKLDTLAIYYIGGKSGYGDGDGGEYEIRLVHSADQTVMGFATHDPIYLDGLNRPSMTTAQVRNDMFPVQQFYTNESKTTRGTASLVSGVTYDIVIRNVHPDPNNNYMGLDMALEMESTGRSPDVPGAADWAVGSYNYNTFALNAPLSSTNIPIFSATMADGTTFGHGYINGHRAFDRENLTTGDKVRQLCTVSGVNGASRLGVRAYGSGTIVGRITDHSGNQIGSQTAAISISGHDWYSAPITVDSALTSCAIEFEVTSGSVDFQAMRDGTFYNMSHAADDGMGGAQVNTSGSWGWFNTTYQDQSHLTAYFVPIT